MVATMTVPDTGALAVPLTPAQLRALQCRFRYLGYTRPERLAAATAVLGCDQPLRSFNDLRFGQAGYLMGWLRRGGDWDGAVSVVDPEAVPGIRAVPAETETGLVMTRSGDRMRPAESPDAADPAADAVAAGGIALAVAAAAWLALAMPVLARQHLRAAIAADASPAGRSIA
jgi:hypothetical protein